MRRRLLAILFSTVFLLQAGGSYWYYLECKVRNLVTTQHCDCEKLMAADNPNHLLPFISTAIPAPIEWQFQYAPAYNCSLVLADIKKSFASLNEAYKFAYNADQLRPPIA
jgi:hypothetical protein